MFTREGNYATFWISCANSSSEETRTKSHRTLEATAYANSHNCCSAELTTEVCAVHQCIPVYSLLLRCLKTSLPSQLKPKLANTTKTTRYYARPLTEKMDVNTVIDAIGNRGKYHFILGTLLAVTVMNLAMNNLSTVVFGYLPPHR